jgi:hypothetical protein
MIAQTTAEVIHGVTTAYVFTLRFREGAPSTLGIIANSRDEAYEKVKNRISTLGEFVESVFGSGFAHLQPAMITRTDRSRWTEEKGYYAFLQGIFFARYGDTEVIAGCRQDKTSTGWYATIYGCSHSIKPL